MDRPLTSQHHHRRRLRRLGLAVLVLIVAAIMVLAIRAWLSPSVDRSRIRTALVERGPVTETLTASGTVVPRRQTVITSAVDTRIGRILVRPGEQVESGQNLVDLDLTGARLALDRLSDQLALKQNERVRRALTLQAERRDLAGRREVLALEYEARGYETSRNEEYFELGLISDDELRRSKTDARRAAIELRQVEAALSNADSTLTAELAGLDLELSILARDRDDAARRLSLAHAASDRAGVVTWVVNEEGAMVREGDVLARVSDLSDYRVEANVADVHVGRVQAGQSVVVANGAQRLAGHVTRIRPTVEDGALVLEIDLEQPDHPDLRPNLRVEVHVVTATHSDALRVKRGLFLARDGSQKAYVIEGEVAHRREIELGLVSYDYYEVISGLQEHDEVIISDMSHHQHRATVRLR